MGGREVSKKHCVYSVSEHVCHICKKRFFYFFIFSLGRCPNVIFRAVVCCLGVGWSCPSGQRVQQILQEEIWVCDFREETWKRNIRSSLNDRAASDGSISQINLDLEYTLNWNFLSWVSYNWSGASVYWPTTSKNSDKDSAGMSSSWKALRTRSEAS